MFEGPDSSKEAKEHTEEHRNKHKIKSKPSFNSKNSLAKVNPSGSFARPIHRLFSHEKDPGMTDKLHTLMDSYIPKDIPSIQKAYPCPHVESYTMFNTLWQEQGSISRKVIATKPWHTLCETGWSKVSTIRIEPSTKRVAKKFTTCLWSFWLEGACKMLWTTWIFRRNTRRLWKIWDTIWKVFIKNKLMLLWVTVAWAD